MSNDVPDAAEQIEILFVKIKKICDQNMLNKSIVIQDFIHMMLIEIKNDKEIKNV